VKREIVTLCGSTRFFAQFQRANYELTMEGKIVLSVGFYPKEVHGEEHGCTPEQKLELDELHLDKIDLSERIHVLNVGGYIGSSTAREIAYAIGTHKEVTFLEPAAGGNYLIDDSHELGWLCAQALMDRAR
jgi:hypothetical protein